MPNKEHPEILRRGVEEWNAWRKEHLEIVPDLTGVRFTGATLSGARLDGARLDGARLTNARLDRARRGELLERPNAHCYETGGMRRTYLRGHPNIWKRLLIYDAGFNLGLLMRQRFGIGKPRVLLSES